MTVLTETFTLNNGVVIPKVGFGTWQIPDGDAAYAAVSDALELGYRHIDTAYAYGNERSVGRAVRDSGLAREEVFVTSKLPAEVKEAGRVEDYFNRTLNNLDFDYLDLYLIHAPWPWDRIGTRMDRGNVAVWKVLEKLQQQGRIRAIGVSNFDAHDLQNIADNAQTLPAVDQIQYYVGFTEPTITAFAQRRGLLVEAYSPLATGGLLRNADLSEVAERYHVSVPQLALRFVLQNGVLPLPKAASRKHIAANAQLDFVISDADMDTLRNLSDTAPERRHNATQG